MSCPLTEALLHSWPSLRPIWQLPTRYGGSRGPLGYSHQSTSTILKITRGDYGITLVVVFFDGMEWEDRKTGLETICHQGGESWLKWLSLRMHDPQTTSIIEMKLTFTNNIKVIYRVSNNKKILLTKFTQKYQKSRKGSTFLYYESSEKRNFDQQCM